MKRAIRELPTFVVDASMALSWFFADEDESYANAVLTKLATAAAVAPSLWPIEIANAVLVGERRSRCTHAQAARWLDDLSELSIIIDDETPIRAWTFTLELGRRHALSAYDASYLELALRRRLPIATLDDELKTAARKAGVESYEP